ncbi:MAG: hypothetical protein WBX37_18870, partial [Pseudolabrys sp.]
RSALLQVLAIPIAIIRFRSRLILAVGLFHLTNVRYWHLADIGLCAAYVRYTFCTENVWF